MFDCKIYIGIYPGSFLLVLHIYRCYITSLGSADFLSYSSYYFVVEQVSVSPNSLPRSDSTKLQVLSANMGDNENFPVTLGNPSLLESRGLIAGSWRTAKDGKIFPVYEPSTGNVLHCCSDFSREEFVEAIESASEGYRVYYETTTAAERAGILRAWHSLLQKNLDDRKSESLKPHTPA